MHSHETEQEALADEEAVDDYDDWCLGNGFEFVDLQERPSDLTQGTSCIAPLFGLFLGLCDAKH